MSGMTEIGYLDLNFRITVFGPMSKEQANKLKGELIEFFREKKVNVDGDMDYIAISKFHVKKSNANIDTSS